MFFLSLLITLQENIHTKLIVRRLEGYMDATTTALNHIVEFRPCSVISELRTYLLNIWLTMFWVNLVVKDRYGRELLGYGRLNNKFGGRPSLVADSTQNTNMPYRFYP